MSGVGNNHYADISFVLQALDNTTTYTYIDQSLLQSWIEDGNSSVLSPQQANAALFESIGLIQLKGEQVSVGTALGGIHAATFQRAFVTQISIDTRDAAGRPAYLMCYGRLPRGRSQDCLNTMVRFLNRHGIRASPRTLERFRTMERWLVDAPVGRNESLMSSALGFLGFSPPDLEQDVVRIQRGLPAHREDRVALGAEADEVERLAQSFDPSYRLSGGGPKTDAAEDARFKANIEPAHETPTSMPCPDGHLAASQGPGTEPKRELGRPSVGTGPSAGRFASESIEGMPEDRDEVPSVQSSLVEQGPSEGEKSGRGGTDLARTCEGDGAWSPVARGLGGWMRAHIQFGRNSGDE